VSDFFAAYGLFLAQLATFVVVLIVVVVLVASSRRRGHTDGLVVEHLENPGSENPGSEPFLTEGL